VKNMLLIDGSMVATRPDVNLFASWAKIYGYFAEKHG